MPVLLPFSLLRERWRIRNRAESTCPNCGQCYGKSSVESALDSAHRRAFDENENPVDAGVTCIVVTCESCGVETEFPW